MLLFYQLLICKFVVPKTDEDLGAVHVLMNQKNLSFVGV